MAPGQPGKPTRRRNRKRKRRVASDSSSSDKDTSSSSSSEASTSKKAVTIPARQPKPSENTVADEDEDEDDLSSSSDDSQDDSSPDEQDVMFAPSTKPGQPKPPPERHSPSPEPDVDIPPFILPDTPVSEQALKEKFRKFWMASIAEGFKDDLEEIRKEPNLGPSRLALLIESLASGADVFSSSSMGPDVNEMEVVLDQLS